MMWDVGLVSSSSSSTSPAEYEGGRNEKDSKKDKGIERRVSVKLLWFHGDVSVAV